MVEFDVDSGIRCWDSILIVEYDGGIRCTYEEAHASDDPRGKLSRRDRSILPRRVLAASARIASCYVLDFHSRAHTRVVQQHPSSQQHLYERQRKTSFNDSNDTIDLTGVSFFNFVKNA